MSDQRHTLVKKMAHQLHASRPSCENIKRSIKSRLLFNIASLTLVTEVLRSHTFFSSIQFSSVAQSCPTLFDPMNHSTPGLPVHHQLPEFTQTHVHRVSDADVCNLFPEVPFHLLTADTSNCIFSSLSSGLCCQPCVCVCVCACVCVHTHACCNIQFFVTPWIIAHWVPLSMGFPRQEYWSRLPFPTPRDLPDLGMQPTSLASPALAGEFVTRTVPPEKSDWALFNWHHPCSEPPGSKEKTHPQGKEKCVWDHFSSYLPWFCIPVLFITSFPLEKGKKSRSSNINCGFA